MSKRTIITANVTAKRINDDNGIAWEMADGVRHKYGYAYSVTTAGELCQNLHMPIGTTIIGDVIRAKRTYYNGDKKTEYIETCFQPHDNVITAAQARMWSKMNWINCFGNDEHYYNDVESVTYKDPKTGKQRKDKVSCISIQNEINVYVHRKSGKYPVMAIPINNIVERHLKIYKD